MLFHQTISFEFDHLDIVARSIKTAQTSSLPRVSKLYRRLVADKEIILPKLFLDMVYDIEFRYSRHLNPLINFFTIIDRILGKNPRTNDKFIIIVKKLLFLF